MIKYLLFFISLLIISCSSQKFVQNKKAVVILNKSKPDTIYLVYDNNSKESIILDELSSKLLNLSYKQILLPSSQIKNYKKFYNSDNKNIIISLGNSIYRLNDILKLKYNLLIIDSPNKYGNIPNNLDASRTIIISDLNTIKYAYKIINNNNYSLFFKKDKYAWLLSKEKFLALKYKNSKIKFKQIKNKIILDKNLDNKLLILFTTKEALLKRCNKYCILPSDTYVKSVYVIVNNDFDSPQAYNKLSIKIKKIFKLINQKKYLDTYLFMLENKNKFNLKFFKKIFAIISKPLYKIEPDLKVDRDLEFNN